MQSKRLKFIVVTVLLLGGFSGLLFRFFEPEILSMDWQPLPEIPQDVEFSNVYQANLTAVIKKAEQKLQQGRENLGSPGISIAVGVKGEMVWAAGFGYADIAQKKAIALDSQFRIGSTAKALTAIVLARLLETQQLALDDTIGQYLPNLTPALHSITVRQLASHQSGIRNYQRCLCLPSHEYFNNDQYTLVTQAIEAFVYDPLLFQPGEQFAYSSYNYTLLSAVMERAANKPFVTLMQELLFSPLAMTNTLLEGSQKAATNPVSFYNVGYGYYQSSYEVNNSNKWAGGGLLSTPSDLVTMANTLLHGNLLQGKTQRILFEPQKLNNAEVNPQNYAIGWRVSDSVLVDEDVSVKYWHHGGTAVGSSSLLVIFPDSQVTVSVLINSSIANFSELWSLTMDIAKMFVHPT